MYYSKLYAVKKMPESWLKKGEIAHLVVISPMMVVNARLPVWWQKGASAG